LDAERGEIQARMKPLEEAARETSRQAFLKRYGLADTRGSTTPPAGTNDPVAAERGAARNKFVRRYGLDPSRGFQAGGPSNSLSSKQLMSRYGLTSRTESQLERGTPGGSTGLSNRDIPFTVLVDGRGALHLSGDSKSITAEELKAKLSKEMGKNPDLRVAIKADRNAPFGQVIQIMDAAKDANVRNVNAFAEDVGNR
jgi:biopolymer transport protein ExbD